jgi:mycofactocin glycosyltransferase
VIVPFAGTDAQLDRLLAELSGVALRDNDEVIVADNRLAGTSFDRGRIQVRAAGGLRTPGFARNAGARLATGQWLVFVDADTSPAPSLLDAYFDPPPAPSTAVLAGGIVDTAPDGAGATARHSVAREQMSQSKTLQRDWPYAQTANCAMRRSAFEQVGGFAVQARAGEDAELCFRLKAAGWEIEKRAAAVVKHKSRETLPALLTQLAHHGSGAAWANRRFPGSFPPPTPNQVARRLGHEGRGLLAALARRDRAGAERAVVELLGAVAFEVGRLLPNRRPTRACRRATRGSHG